MFLPERLGFDEAALLACPAGRLKEVCPLTIL
jgi:hypothetical protein